MRFLLCTLVYTWRFSRGINLTTRKNVHLLTDLLIVISNLGMAVEDLTTITSSELLDVEDEISTPVTTTVVNNGNTDTNPVRETSTFISSQLNGVIIIIMCFCLIK